MAKTEHIRSISPKTLKITLKNGVFPFTILLFLTLFVCRNESNIQYTTMAGKTKEMSQIKQLLLLKKEGVQPQGCRNSRHQQGDREQLRKEVTVPSIFFDK